MKKIRFISLTAGFVLALAVSTILTGCGGDNVVDLSSLQKRGDVFVVPETQKPYSGEFIVSDGNNVAIAGTLKKGKVHGKVTSYTNDGSIYEVYTFADGVLNGKQLKYAYSENGKIELVANYKDGKLNPSVKKATFTDSRDGKKYKTVKIDAQTWMTENLNYNASGSRCYENDENNCQKYGRLYDWNTAMGACPKGWHLPSDNEYEVLYYATGGKHLEEFGFSALLGGRNYSGNIFDEVSQGWRISTVFDNVGSYGYWWSATERDSDVAYHHMIYHNGNVGRKYDLKSYLFSVRCLQD